MSRLEELIQKQRQFPIVDLHTVVKRKCSGATPAKGNREYYDGGNIPWLRTQDVRFNEIVEVESYITEKAVNETAVKWIPENCVIVAISGASAGRCAINKIRTTTNQHCLNLEIDSSKALYKYIYYCIANQYQELLSRKQGARGDLNSSLILSLKIPLPPLEVQREIVRILDHFTELTTELTTELATELAARKKQYEYYRDHLLTFGDDVETRALDKCCIISRGDYITKKNATPGKIPVILGGQEPAYYIDRYNHLGKAIVISRSGASAGFVSYWNEPIFVTDGFIIEGTDQINIRFLYFYLKNLQQKLNSMKKGGGVPHITGKNIGEIQIPILPISYQEKLIDILDRFDTLCNDLTAGLPAEIEARRKQYEYYRDKLLTFELLAD